MFRRFVLPLLAMLAFANSASAATLLANDWFFASARTSDYGTLDGAGWRTYDDFELKQTAWVESLSWDFFFLGGLTPAPAPASDANQWIVSFYADNGSGEPGALLANHSFAPADVTRSAIGSGVYSIGMGNNYNVIANRYSVTLPTRLLLTADTPYWLSVFVLSDHATPGGAWMAGGDELGGGSFQELLGAGQSVVQSFDRARDRAFALEGTVVPEPTTMVLVGVPFLAGAIRRRRTQK